MESATDETLIGAALGAARDTRLLETRAGVRHDAARAFAAQFGDARAIVIADANTFRAAGRDVAASFEREQRPLAPPFIFGPHVYADERCVEELRAVLAATPAIPVAVGSGTINDLTKLAAHRVGRQYLAVATAASMDGYTAYGASITANGSKQTFDCPAPRAVLADLEVIAGAPKGMNAAGYADLLAKIAAGADWIVADALEVEPIQDAVWRTVQARLKDWVSRPAEVARGDAAALAHLASGLMMSGFAMQAARSSRPASGADHQFSHLWDMQHHMHEGQAPSHGFKVGIGTLASVALYEQLLAHDLARLDVERAVQAWPTLAELMARVGTIFGDGELADTARLETEAKYVSPSVLWQQLGRLREVWPELRQRLAEHLLPLAELRDMLARAGCPTRPEQIGISRSRLRASYEQATFIRRRFTVLDLAQRTGLFDECLEGLFGAGGPWHERTANERGTSA